MYTELVCNKLCEQEKVYQRLKNGDTSIVQYQEFHDKEWGTRDANYVNRERLAYYLLYMNIDDEDAVAYLFNEELKDRKSNSFQGIGNTLNVLASLLNRYNVGGKYDVLLEEAKSANFDCACGFDKNCRMDRDMNALDLMDCIFLAEDLEYRDVMEVLVEQWKDGITEWTAANREALIRFHTVLGKEGENEMLYKVLLEQAIMGSEDFKIVSAYNHLIRYYIERKSLEEAYCYLHRMIETVDFDGVVRFRLFGDVLDKVLPLSRTFLI